MGDGGSAAAGGWVPAGKGDGEPVTAPLIGITSYREEAAWGVWRQAADVLPAQYARAVEAAGGVPVLLPPVTTVPDAAASVLARLDGLVVAGGADVDPARYGASPHARTGAARADRDSWELALIGAARDRALPLLGVCRGMQLLAVQAGGTLEQHTPDRVGDDRHSPGGDAFGSIPVQTVPGTRLAALVGARLAVNCHHHQAVAEHPGFAAAAWSAEGTLEAIEDSETGFCLGVQWHPETAVDAGLFAGLVEASRVRLRRSR
jgi:putative glutamine amidotransferase